MRLLASNTTALGVDIQEKFVPHISKYDQMLDRIRMLIQGLQILDIKIAVTEQNPQKLGPTVSSVEELLKNFNPIEKIEFSCYDSVDYKSWLDQNPCQNILLFGIETHVCVLQTAVDLKQAGYNPVVVEDAVSSRSDENKAIAFKRFDLEHVMVTSVESVLFELLRSFSNPIAKRILQLVK
ncbi:Isochorismatase family protein [Brevinema andersonii]|uniref:Isochorismatase family protein n=1 Tax=Brevinema andersonii TaxID=34097 RepID=A0A1I1DIE7_BREAD|nr:isochorismatase family protein [Brevinema andersonii]SFB74637.1 Isochorismatase family protein [Brevinema andersonii]